MKDEVSEKVVVRRVVHAKRERVFDAWTKPELMNQWFFPGDETAESTNDFRIGGKYRHEMIPRPGSDVRCKTDTGTYVHTGEYLEISPPNRLVFTWSSPMVENTRVTVELREVNGGTEVVITHELLLTSEVREAHTQGWQGCLSNLSAFLT